MPNFPNIAFLTGHLAMGGSERNLYQFVRALHGAGARVQVLSMNAGGHWHGEFQRLGVPCRVVGSSRLVAPQLARILRELRGCSAEIVQAGHYWVNPYVLTAARLLGIREIGAVNSGLDDEMHKLPAWVSRQVLRQTRLFAVRSRAAMADAARLGVPESRLAYLPGVVDTEVFAPPARSPDGPVTLLAVGRLVSVKRYDRLLRVLARVATQTTTPFRAVIVGSGPEQERLRDLAASARFSPGQIEFCPATPLVVEHYRKSHIFVHTADVEGTPTVLLEAMACGLPVVATRAGGSGEVIGDGEQGFLAACDEEETLAQRLCELIGNPLLRRRLGDAGRARACAQFSTALLPDRLAELYRRRLGD